MLIGSLSEAGNHVKNEVWHAVIVVITNASNLHGYTVRSLYKASLRWSNEMQRMRAMNSPMMTNDNECLVQPCNNSLNAYMEIVYLFHQTARGDGLGQSVGIKSCFNYMDSNGWNFVSFTFFLLILIREKELDASGYEEYIRHPVQSMSFKW
ncbi:AP-1 complex subunit gamma-2-like protein, partial [Tanacetum coccineum]